MHARATEGESGGGVIDAILSTQVLSVVGREILHGAMNGVQLKHIQVTADDRNLSVAVPQCCASDDAFGLERRQRLRRHSKA